MINDGIVVGDATGRKEGEKGQGGCEATAGGGENVMINPRERVYHLRRKRRRVIASHQCIGIDPMSGIPRDCHAGSLAKRSFSQSESQSSESA